MKMGKQDPRRALTVLKPCGNAFSAQKTYMGSILDRKALQHWLKMSKNGIFDHFTPKIS